MKFHIFFHIALMEYCLGTKEDLFSWYMVKALPVRVWPSVTPNQRVAQLRPLMVDGYGRELPKPETHAASVRRGVMCVLPTVATDINIAPCRKTCSVHAFLAVADSVPSMRNLTALLEVCDS